MMAITKTLSTINYKPQLTQTTKTQTRLVELDALRGIAALLVMLFHFTSRYDQLYGHITLPLFSVPWGHFGVNLFFMISGFVIFMTLHRVRQPHDFVVSRFSRLFPAYWVAVLLTFLLTQAFALPHKIVGIDTAAMNLFMLHGLLKIPHVDGVYWTLEIELIFYGMALLLYLSGLINRVHLFLMALLGLRLAYLLASKLAGIELSWTLSHLLILPYIAWFALGIMIYHRTTFPDQSPQKDWSVLIAALIILGIVDGIHIALLAVLFTALFWAAAKGKLPLLNNPLLTWLGAISYTLYLLHENIGWGLIRLAEQNGIASNIAIVMAICIVLALATGLSYLIERPAMRWLRTRYKNSTMASISNRILLLIGTAILCIFLGLAYSWHQANPPKVPQNLVANIFTPSPADAVPCALSDQRPLMLLVLGQSNAGNHGEPLSVTPQPSSAATFFHRGNCHRTFGLAPGATGEGANVWTTLGPMLEQHFGRPVIFSVLAISATSIHDWVTPGPLHTRLLEILREQQQHGFLPDAVLWQQGEADARSGISQTEYERDFKKLASLLRAYGVNAPVLAALSTRCRNQGSDAVRAAIAQVASHDPSIRVGPDTDLLTGTLYRHDGCHFSEAGIGEVAKRWASAIETLLGTTHPAK